MFQGNQLQKKLIINKKTLRLVYWKVSENTEKRWRNWRPMTKAKSRGQILWLSIDLCQNIYETFSRKYGEVGLEPLPNFETRYPNRLESILNSVQLKADLLNFNVPRIAASYFVHFVRSQAHLNGNKRMGVIYTYVFLYLNGYDLLINQKFMFDLSLMVVTDDINEFEKIEDAVGGVFKGLVKKRK